MEDYKSVNREIEKLALMVPGGFFSIEKPDWKSIWKQIRLVGSSFKGVKFPTHEEHQQAWDKFQSLVSDVKHAQEEEQENWLRKKTESARLRDRIISQAHSARPSNGMADMILAIATGGVSVVLSALMGPFDDRKRELEAASSQLKKGWDMLNEYKGEMLGRDKKDAFQALNETKEYLDRAWEDYKRERQKAYDDYQREHEEKHRAWLQRTQENVRKLEERRDRLNSVLSHKESHLDDLRSKLSDAWSDSYRERISGWIAEEESDIQDIRSKLSDVENWLYEARNKLNS